MFSPTLGAPRVLRAGVFGAVAFGLALSAHAAAGGPLPAAAVLGAAGGFIVSASVLVTGRRLGRVAMATCLGASQLVLHATFSFLGTSAGCAPPSMPSPMPTGMHGEHLAPGALGLGRCTSMGSMHSSAWMVAAHVVATLLTAAVLAHGERVLWLLATWAPLLGVRLLAPVPQWRPPTLLPEPAIDLGWVLKPSPSTAGVGRRGPPGRPWCPAPDRLTLPDPTGSGGRG